MKRLLLIGAIALWAAGGVAQGAGKANTKVVFGGANFNSSDGSTTYYGNIESPKKACANKRKVTVYMDGGSGRDEKIGSAKSQPGKVDTHFWEVVQTDPALAGTYYAKAKTTDDCRGDRSKDFLYTR